MLFGSIEAGGTKFVCAIGTDKGEVLEKISIATTQPIETMKQVVAFFQSKKIAAIGVGCFGPIDPNISSATYGYITKTPKSGWSDYNIIGELKQHFDIPIAFDTDVNAAALGELKWGAAQGVSSSLYITVGTGIGAGAVVEGNLVHGLLHPEMGHILVRKHEQDNYSGKCPFHGDCLEGLASGPAIEERWEKKANDLPSDHQAWQIEAYYLAQAIVNYILILSPEKIIMGGGVMKQKQLFPLITNKVQELLNGYVGKEEILSNIEEYIVAPLLDDNAGICGGFAIAIKAYDTV